MKVILLEGPTEKDWMEVKRRALVTSWKKPINQPDPEWKKKILRARHSPIRRLWFSFQFEGIPSNIATHFARHVHAQPYISSLRNDRQEKMDGDTAPRNTPVNMILDMNAEELMVMANKRLCRLASRETQLVMAEMCRLVLTEYREFSGLLVAACQYNGGVCHEMHGCGRCPQC